MVPSPVEVAKGGGGIPSVYTYFYISQSSMGDPKFWENWYPGMGATKTGKFGFRRATIAVSVGMPHAYRHLD